MKSEIVATSVIDKLLGGVDFSPPASVWVALYTIPPDAGGGGVEVSGNGYARVEVPNDLPNWPLATAGIKGNALTIQFPAPLGTWGEVIAFGLHDHPTDDALYLWGELEDAITPDVGSDVRFTPGDLTVEEV